MGTLEVTESSTVRAPAAAIHAIVADYRDGHRRIVPPRYFPWLAVEHGGKGEGTRIHFAMRALGRTRAVRATVTEPSPGRVLVETIAEDQIVTTFTFDPEASDRTRVTIATRMPVRAGLAGAIERFVSSRLLRRIYREELRRLAEHAEGRAVHAPVPAGPEGSA